MHPGFGAMRRVLIGMLAAALSGCGGTASAGPATPYTTWVNAVAQRDAATAQTVIVPGRGIQVSNAWGKLDRTGNGTFSLADVGTDTLQITATNATGTSRWAVGGTSVCYQTLLEQVQDTWQVANWTETPCE